jgi:hypothetical protein
MAEATNSTPPGVFTRRFLVTVAARVSTFAAAGEPWRGGGGGAPSARGGVGGVLAYIV